MQLAGDALAFRQPGSEPRVEPGGSLVEPKAIETGHEQASHGNGADAEPDCFVEVRLLYDRVDHACPVPNTVAIACAHMKSMRPMGNVAVDGVTGRAGVEPFRIYFVQPVLEANLFRRGDLDDVEIQLDVMRTRGQNQFVTGSLGASAHGDFLHVNLRRSVCPRQSWEVQHCYSLRSRDPELAVSRQSRKGRAITALQ